MNSSWRRIFSMRVLLVEDEPAAAHVLAKGLREQAYAVDVAADGDSGALSGRHDRLRRRDSRRHAAAPRRLRGVPRDSRRAAAPVPILMLTARDAVEARIEGLDCGADDYLVKPFDFGELLARLRALIRRGRQPLLPERLDRRAARRSTRAAGACASAAARSPLTAKEYALLEYLARRAGDVVGRADIAEHVWDEHYDPFSNVVDVYMQRLRRKLDRAGRRVADPHAPRRRLSAVAAERVVSDAVAARAADGVVHARAAASCSALFGADVLWQQRRLGLRRVDRELDGDARDARQYPAATS